MHVGSVYVVVGGAGGIGSSVCTTLREFGSTVVAAGRNVDKLRELSDRIGVHPLTLDATRSREMNEGLADVLSRFGRIDGIVNCVGSLLLKPAHSTTDDEWQQVISTNLTSAFVTVKSAASVMQSTGGSIVLVSSAAARVGLANHEAIAAAKAGIIGLTLSAAATYADRGIRVNCVAPGLVRTPMTSGLLTSEANLNASIAMHPAGRIGEPADVASAIEWLLNSRQGWVTGQVIGVDGGLASLRSRVRR